MREMHAFGCVDPCFCQFPPYEKQFNVLKYRGLFLASINIVMHEETGKRWRLHAQDVVIEIKINDPPTLQNIMLPLPMQVSRIVIIQRKATKFVT